MELVDENEIINQQIDERRNSSKVEACLLRWIHCGLSATWAGGIWPYTGVNCTLRRQRQGSLTMLAIEKIKRNINALSN